MSYTINLTGEEIDARLDKVPELEAALPDIDEKLTEIKTGIDELGADVALLLPLSEAVAQVQTTLEHIEEQVEGGGVPLVDMGEITGAYSSAYTIYFTLTGFVRYAEIGAGNILCQLTAFAKTTTAYALTLSYSYTPSNGILTVTSPYSLFANSPPKAQIWIMG